MLAQSRRNRRLRCALEEILLQQAEESRPYSISDQSELLEQRRWDYQFRTSGTTCDSNPFRAMFCTIRGSISI